MLGQDLDGDVAAEFAVVASIDLAHAASANQRYDLIRTKACTCGDGHSSR